MRIIYFRLKGYVRILNGTGLDEISIDFSNFKNRIVLIQGENGCGKSTIISAMTPNPDGSDSFRTDVFIDEYGNRQIIEYPAEKEIHYIGKDEFGKDTIYSILNESFKKNKKGILKKYISKIKYSPGFFAFLHTFGRDLKWNPHIHILIAEIKLGNKNTCKPRTFFDYDALSLRFQKILLDLLSKELGKSFNKLKSSLFKNYSNGFYVYAEPKKFKDLKSGVEYVTRYCGRVPISENRIVNYDGSNVTFSYIDHNDHKYHEVTLSASEFIMILLRHLLPSQFKIIRYYGFYRKKHSMHNKMIPLIKDHLRTFRRKLLKHELSISLAFHRNPYNCPKCNTKMDLVLYIN